MIFQIPALLWALPLAVLPLALHLIFRRRAKRAPFSDSLFLRLAYSRMKPLSKLRQWLLAVLRCLILLCLILAGAGPILESASGAAASARGTDVLLLLDESYSMRYREEGKTRFEQAQDVARGVLSGLRPSDRAAVEFFSDKPAIANAGLSWMAPAQAEALIAAARPGYETTDYAPALKAAQDFLQKDKSGHRRAALILSDGCAHGMKEPPPALDSSILWLGLSWPEASNIAIASARLDPGLAGANPALDVEVSGFGSESRDALEVRLGQSRLPDALIRGDGPVREAHAALPQVPGSSDAAWWGRLDVLPDALSEDDEYFYSFRRLTLPRVLCLYSASDFFSLPKPGYFLRPLLGGAQASLLPFNVDFLSQDSLAGADLSRYQAVFLPDAGEISGEDARLLKNFVAQGGGLLLVSGAAADLQTLAALAPWLCAGVGPTVSAESGGIKPANTPNQRPSEVWDGFNLKSVSLGSYNLLQPKSGARVILQSASGYPLLVSGQFGQGRTEIWAGSLDAATSNMVIKPVFVAWMQEALSEVAQAGSQAENLSLTIGEPIVRRWPISEAAPAYVRVQEPDERSDMVWLKNRELFFQGTDAPGFYTVSDQNSDKSWVYAVNLDRASGESDLSALGSPPWKTVAVQEAAAQLPLFLRGKSARDWLLILAAILLTVETLLALGPGQARGAAAALFLLAFLARPSPAQPAAASDQGDRFVWTQIKLGQDWDPYPGVPQQILSYISQLTSILTYPKRRVITLDDPALFSSPLVILAGDKAPPPLSAAEEKNLRDYLDGGGLLWLEDVSGSQVSAFDAWARKTMPRVLPGASFQDARPDDVIYKSFFLLRGPAGRVMTRGTLEKIVWGARAAVIYSREDILGAWAVDALGAPLYPCVPGGESQREMAKRLTLNLVMFSLTGTYKDDAVHQPYILMKMRSEAP